MTLPRYQRARRLLRTTPPATLWQKVKRRLGREVRNQVNRRRAQWFSTELTDAAFLRALDPRFATIDAWLAHMATRTTPHFFIAAAGRTDVVAALRRHCPQSEAATIRAADAACAHRFDLLGSGPTDLGAQIDWQRDFKSGYRWDPRQYYADVRAAPPPGGYDLKVPWELSRCQHFAWLGQAYWFTGNEKYAQEFVDQVRQWLAANPPQLGVNWACAMDVAIRAVNWLWGYAFFQASPNLTADFRRAFFKGLLVHGQHIFANLEYSETLTSNHYLSDIVGLVYLGILLPEFKAAQGWRRFGLQELERELFKQVYPDGMDFEASVSYHRLVAELFLSATLLAQHNGHSFSAAYLERLEKMMEFTLAVTKPDGLAPLIGDCDNGRLHRLKAWGSALLEWQDHRHLLAVGAWLFKRSDFAAAAGDQWEEALWLSAGQAVDQFASAPQNQAPASRAFEDGGIFVLRHADWQVTVCAGQAGQQGNGGHAHNDIGSFELFAAGVAWIVDPGTYLYTADYAARNRFRSTAVHNTVMVAGVEQRPFDPDRLFSMGGDPAVRVVNWQTNAEQDRLVIEHEGYLRLGVIHRREFRLDKLAGELTVADQLLSPGRAPVSHEMQANLCLGPAVVGGHLRGNQVSLRHPAAAAALAISWTGGKDCMAQWRDTELAPGYGTLVHSRGLSFVQRSNELVTQFRLADSTHSDATAT